MESLVHGSWTESEEQDDIKSPDLWMKTSGRFLFIFLITFPGMTLSVLLPSVLSFFLERPTILSSSYFIDFLPGLAWNFAIYGDKLDQ